MDETKENYTQSFCLKEESIDEPVMKWESKLKKKTELGNEEHLPND